MLFYAILFYTTLLYVFATQELQYGRKLELMQRQQVLCEIDDNLVLVLGRRSQPQPVSKSSRFIVSSRPWGLELSKGYVSKETLLDLL